MPEDNQGFCSIVQDQQSVRPVGCSINNTPLRWWIRIGEKKMPPEDLLHNLVVAGKEQLWLVTLTMASFSSSVPVKSRLAQHRDPETEAANKVQPSCVLSVAPVILLTDGSFQLRIRREGVGVGCWIQPPGFSCCHSAGQMLLKHHQESNGPFQTTLSLSVSFTQRVRERERGGLWMICITTCSRFVLLVIRCWWICAEGFVMSGFGRRLATLENNVWSQIAGDLYLINI